MECATPDGAGTYDLCWLDNITMLMAQFNDRKVWKATINYVTNSCDYQIFDSGYAPYKVVCSPERDNIYVLDHYNENFRVHSRAGGEVMWNPNVGRVFTIAMNMENIVLSPRYEGPLFVFDHNKSFLYRVSVDGDQHILIYSHLTDAGLYLTTPGDQLHILNLKTNSSLTVGGHGTGDGEFDSSTGVTTAGEGIIVADYRNNRLCVFSQAGVFLKHMTFVGGGVNYPRSLSVLPDNNLLAVITGSSTNLLKLYRLT